MWQKGVTTFCFVLALTFAGVILNGVGVATTIHVHVRRTGKRNRAANKNLTFEGFYSMVEWEA